MLGQHEFVVLAIIFPFFEEFLSACKGRSHQRWTCSLLRQRWGTWEGWRSTPGHCSVLSEHHLHLSLAAEHLPLVLMPHRSWWPLVFKPGLGQWGERGQHPGKKRPIPHTPEKTLTWGSLSQQQRVLLSHLRFGLEPETTPKSLHLPQDEASGPQQQVTDLWWGKGRRQMAWKGLVRV